MKLDIFQLIDSFAADGWEPYSSDEYYPEDGSACYEFVKDNIMAALFISHNKYDQLITWQVSDGLKEERHVASHKQNSISSTRLAMLPQAMKDKINEIANF